MKFYVFSNLESPAIKFALRYSRGVWYIWTIKDPARFYRADSLDFESVDSIVADYANYAHAMARAFARGVALCRHAWNCSEKFRADGVLSE